MDTQSSTPIYEGKAKKLFASSTPDQVLVEYKDSLTAFNGQKKDSMAGKGFYTNQISCLLFQYLNSKGVATHFVEPLGDLTHMAKKVSIIPLEVVVRNIATGSLCKRLGVPDKQKFPRPLLELYLKDDNLGDPIVTDDHALLFGWSTEEELAEVKSRALEINKLLGELFDSIGIVLADFKLEFGKTPDGELVLADEISPDTCRFWDKKTLEKLDKDRFRQDLGNVLGAYEEILKRLKERLT